MEVKEYQLLDSRTIRCHVDKLGMTKISQENLEKFVEEFNTSYRQAKILEKIKENYAKYRVALESIKSEITDTFGDAFICEWFEDYDYDENDISEYREIGNVSEIIEIINKYIEEK